MSIENNTDKLTKSTDAIEKWAKNWLFILIVLTPYLYISYKITSSLYNFEPPTDPKQFQCGTGLFAAIIVHFVLAGIVAFIIGIFFIFKSGYALWTKLLIILIILVPPFLSYFAF